MSKYIKLKDPIKKTEAQNRYKQYRNMLSTLMKKSKQFYFTRFFQTNLNDLKNTWKGIKSIISMKNDSHTLPNTITDNNKTLTNPKDIANAFNTYFAKVALNVQLTIKYSKVDFYHFLPLIDVNSFFISPTELY